MSEIESIKTNGTIAMKNAIMLCIKGWVLHLPLMNDSSSQPMNATGKMNFNSREPQVTSGTESKTPHRHMAPGIMGTNPCIVQKYSGTKKRRIPKMIMTAANAR